MISAANEPWDIAAAAELPLASKSTLAAGLGPLLVAQDGEQLSIPGVCLRLPRHGPAFSCGRLGHFVAFDLPAVGRGDRTALNVRYGSSGTTIGVAGQVPHPHAQNVSDVASQEPSGHMQRLIETVVGLMLELRLLGERQAGRVPEKHLPDSLHGILGPQADEFDAGPLRWACIPWAKVATCLRQYGASPSRDVIVSIAENSAFRNILQQLVSRPHRMLRRERQLTALARVQETDHTCLEWLVKRPGRTATEKAGATQEILAVIRRENYDTLENRVLKDFLVRCIRAADMYLRLNEGFGEHSRCKLVDRYRSLCRRMLSDSVLARVGTLYSVPQPNYVLLHDMAYREMWTWYLKLVHRERQADEAWKWQRRLWADLMRLCVGAALHPADDNDLGTAAVFEHRLWVSDEQKDGCWFAPMDWPGPVLFQTRPPMQVVAEWIHPLHPSTDDYGSVAEWCAMLGADMVVRFAPLAERAGGRSACLFIWAIHSAAESPDDERVQRQPSEAANALHAIRQREAGDSVVFRGLILRSNLRDTTVTDLPPGKTENTWVDGLRVPASPTNWAKNGLLQVLRQVLGECALACGDVMQ